MERAAVEAGIPLDEVLAHISEELAKVDPVNMSLRLMGQKALKNGLTKLTKLASGQERIGKNFESTDLLAARELVRASLVAIKMSQTGNAPRDAGPSQRDLFDTAAADPWDLEKVT